MSAEAARRTWQSRLLASPALRVAFVAAALVLAGLGVAQHGGRAWHQADDIGFGRVACSFAAAAAGLWASGLAWRALLRGLGAEVEATAAADIFFVGQLGKYLPGSVFAVLGQVQRGQAAGVSRVQVGAAALATMAMNVASGALVAVAALPFADAGALAHHPEILVVLPLGLAMLHPKVLGPLLDRVLALAHREPLPQRPGGRAIAAALGWSCVVWLCYGAHVWLLAAGLHPAHGDGPRLGLLSLGGYALAWTAGFLVVIAPAGLGVREAALVLVLGPALTDSGALALSVVSRVLMTLGDLGLAGVGALVGRKARLRRWDRAGREAQ